MTLTIDGLQVLYEDNHLLGVIKPAGVLSQSDATGDQSIHDLAKAWLKVKYAKQGKVFLALLHRLDRPVHGVLLFAKTSKAAGRLSSQFRTHTLTKQYVAIVTGQPKASGTLKVSLRRDRNARTTEVVTSDTAHAKAAELHYEVLERQPRFSLLLITPLTGRSHQIRVQLAAAGFPIVGDGKYGSRYLLPQRYIALIATRLTFEHPIHHTPIQLAADPPAWWPWPCREQLLIRNHGHEHR